MVSSSERPIEAVEVAEGGTTAASFFGLLSSLKENYSTSKRRERAKDRKL
jgi:hypothetical protein